MKSCTLSRHSEGMRQVNMRPSNPRTRPPRTQQYYLAYLGNSGALPGGPGSCGVCTVMIYDGVFWISP